ncbi:MAG: hypothetical protein ACBR13_13640 [Microcoleus sp.]
MDFAQLVQIVAPFLPYLMELGGKTAEEAAKKFGSDGLWITAQAVWKKLSPKVQAKVAAKEAAEDVANYPDNENFQTALQVQLQKILQSDEVLAKEIGDLMTRPAKNQNTTTSLVSDSSTHNTARGNIKTVGGNNQESTIVGLPILFIVTLLALGAFGYWVLGNRINNKGIENTPGNPQSQPTLSPSKPSKSP